MKHLALAAALLFAAPAFAADPWRCTLAGHPKAAAAMPELCAIMEAIEGHPPRWNANACASALMLFGMRTLHVDTQRKLAQSIRRDARRALNEPTQTPAPPGPTATPTAIPTTTP